MTATAISLKGANIALTGTVTDGGAGTVNLIATAGTIDETGTLIVGALTGSSTGATTLTGATATTNQVATLGNFTAAGFSLNDGKALSVTGNVNGGATLAIVDSALLTVSGSVTATAISLKGANIALTGTVTDGGAGTVNLIATGGTIDETGTLIAGTLTGSSTGATTLTGATATTNQIATLGNFSAAGFSLNDGKSLNVSGNVAGGTGATIVSNTLLTVSGTVAASAIALKGANIALTGTVADGGAGTVNLIATGGTIDETGTLIAGTLTGSSTGATTLTGATATTNQIATLGNFSAAGFSLNDGKSLNVSGNVAGGTGATIVSNTLLTVSGTVAASAIALKGANIALTGTVADGGAGTVNLIATGGTIDETGTLVAGTLTGSSTGADFKQEAYIYDWTDKMPKDALSAGNLKLGNLVVDSCDHLILSSETTATADCKTHVKLTPTADVLFGQQSTLQRVAASFGKQPDGTWVATGIPYSAPRYNLE